MKIKGIIDISLNEWKDNISSVIFFDGCPLKCKYCQNYLNDSIDISIAEILTKIKNNVFIDSVVISGGEPLEQFEELCEILRFCKKLGLKTAIETSGFYPYRLKYLIEDRFLDKIFLDIKEDMVGRSIENLKLSNKVNIVTKLTLFRTFPDIEKIVSTIKPFEIEVLQQGCPENSENINQNEKLSREEIIIIAKKYGINIIGTKERGEETYEIST